MSNDDRRADALRAAACHSAVLKGLSYAAADAEFERLRAEARRFRQSVDRLFITLDLILTFEGWSPNPIGEHFEAARFSPAPDPDATTLREHVYMSITEQMRSPADAAVFAGAFLDPQDLG